MNSAGVLREIRRRSGLSVRGLAEVSGTSPATVDRIEHARVAPTATLDRIAMSVGYRVELTAVPIRTVRPTREDRRSLAFHRLVAAKVISDPTPVIAKARQNLVTIRRADSTKRSSRYLDEWERLLSGPDHELIAVLLDPGEQASALRQSSPFAGVLTPTERAKVYSTEDVPSAPRPT